MNDDVFSNEYALKLMKLLSPDTRKVMNVRRFIPPHGYMSPNLVVSAFSHHVVEVLHRLDNDIGQVLGSQANLFSLGCWQAFHHWPMFAVTNELTEAMFLTDPPEDIKWSELQWPLPAATFLLPDTEQVRRELHTSKPLAVSVGQIRRSPAGSSAILGRLLERIRMPDNSFIRDMVSILYFDDAAGTTMWHDITAKPEWTLAHSMSKDVARDESTGDVHWNDIDFERMGRAAKLATNFLCFMSSTYQPLAMGGGNGDEPIRKAQVKRNRERDALYGVRWLGESYRLKKAPLGGHHSSPRDHWRRGHYRSQPFGAGRKMRKAIWIEPTWVGGEEKSHNNT